MHKSWIRPATAAAISAATDSTEAFGRNLRDWQHELRHVTSRRAFAQSIAEAPRLLRDQLNDFGQCDAYLAAYVDWLCQRHAVATPVWTHEASRTADKAWFDYPPLWQDSFIHAPAAFRLRGIFTRPEDLLQFKKGRPRTSDDSKRQKGVERQRRYRARIRKKLQQLEVLETSENN